MPTAAHILAIKLDANRSTGYSWQVHPSDAASVFEIGRSYMMPMNMDGQTGVMGSEIIFLAVQNPGNWEMMGVQQFSFDIAAQ